MSRFVRLVIVATLVSGLLAVSGLSALAECSRLDPWPSFTNAIPTAKTVFVGTVVGEPGGFGSVFTVRTDEVLRGDPPALRLFSGFKSRVPLSICPRDSTLRARRTGDRLAFAMDARLPGVPGRIDAVAFVGDSKPNRFMNPKMERLTLRKVRRLAGHAPDGSTVKPPPYTPTGWPPDGLVTEQVEPGVLRVLSDGYRGLSAVGDTSEVFAWGEWTHTHERRHIEAAPDGTISVLDDSGMFRVGSKRSDGLEGEPPVRANDDVEAAPDGTLWRVAVRKDRQPSLHSFDGRSWRGYMPEEQFCGVEVQPDGIVWAIWSRPFGTGNAGCSVDTLGRWNGKRWKAIETPKSWPSYGNQFAVTGNDEVWLCCRDKAWNEQQRLVRFNGRKFKVMDDPAPQPERIDAPLLIDGWPDGTLWMRRSSSTLARHDDAGWTVLTSEDDGVPPMGWVPEGGGFVRAGPDGSVWVSTTTASETADGWPPVCDGVSHFDGSAWSHHLAGMCTFAIDIAPDGTAWVQAAVADTATTPHPQVGEPVAPIQTFVIHPGE